MTQSSFNPKARWDRHIPEAAKQETPELLNENIEVLAWFRKGRIQPRIFIWNNRKYKIKKVNYCWQERLGQAFLNCFSVDTGSDLYQISFNNTSLVWKIDKII